MYTADLFLNYMGAVDEVANEISKLFRIELTKKQDEFGDKYSFYFMDIEFLLYGDHGLEDDCGIIFTDYNYQIQIIKLNYAMKHETYSDMYSKIAMFLTERLSRALNANAMLVDNLQHLVAKIDVGSSLQYNLAYASGE